MTNLGLLPGYLSSCRILSSPHGATFSIAHAFAREEKLGNPYGRGREPRSNPLTGRFDELLRYCAPLKALRRPPSVHSEAAREGSVTDD